MNAFDKISESLGTSFSAAPDFQHVQTELDSFEQKTNELKTFLKEKDELTLEDEKYLSLETKLLIQGGKTVLDKLQEEIKQGSSPRIFEVYSQLLGSVLGGLRELRELNKMVLDIKKINMITSDPTPKTQVNVFMDSKSMSELIKKAKEDSSMNAIDGSFSEVKEVEGI